jgi:large subunit ribosomal protein L29
MKGTKATDLRGKSPDELNQMIDEERKALHDARRALVFRQTTDTASIKTRRHNIARLLSVLGEQKRDAK